MQTDDSLQKQVEAENGGPLAYRTFAIFMGAAGEQSIKHPFELGGLLYIIDDTLFFEDFEKENTLLNLFSKANSYTKFKKTIPLSAIKSVALTTLRESKKVLQGRKAASDCKTIAKAPPIFSRCVTQIICNNGDAWFLELYDHKGFIKFIGDST